MGMERLGEYIETECIYEGDLVSIFAITVMHRNEFGYRFNAEHFNLGSNFRIPVACGRIFSEEEYLGIKRELESGKSPDDVFGKYTEI